jgi:hypothetical protein
VFAGVLHEEGLKVCRACGQDHFVAFDRGVVAGQCDVAECLRLEQVVQDGQQVVSVVVPAKTEDLRQGIHLGNRQLWQQTEKQTKTKQF